MDSKNESVNLETFHVTDQTYKMWITQQCSAEEKLDPNI
jgi:hypothetical protein